MERAENGYREYHTADIARLQEIKLFRKMDISIEEMRALFEKRKSLQFCLEQHLGELERRREGLVKMQEMCERLIARCVYETGTGNKEEYPEISGHGGTPYSGS